MSVTRKPGLLPERPPVVPPPSAVEYFTKDGLPPRITFWPEWGLAVCMLSIIVVALLVRLLLA